MSAPMTWRCFHCGQEFTTEETARAHFGERTSTGGLTTPAWCEGMLEAIGQTLRDAGIKFGAINAAPVRALVRQRDEVRAELAAAQEHERQTHAILGAILGTDTSLENGAWRLRDRADAAMSALRAVLPYAESRAEDLADLATEEAEALLVVCCDGLPLPGADPKRAQQVRAAAGEAAQAVAAAKRLLGITS